MFDLSAVTSALSHEQEGVVITGNGDAHLQLDADGACYHVAKSTTTLEKNMSGLVNYIHTLKQAGGCGTVNVHTTMNLKGGREQMAYYAKYQEKRHGRGEDREYVNRVRALREELFEYQERDLLPYPQYFVEADDSMTQSHYERIAQTGDPRSSIIGTDDKDLNMVAGGLLHLLTKKVTWSGTFTNGVVTENLGTVRHAAATGAKNKKLLGRGMKFFWAQMLAGDSADNIKGVPCISAPLADIYKPLKGYKPRPPHNKVVMGSALAAFIIEKCASELECYHAVVHCYQSEFGADWQFFLFENAFLLWMRRTANTLDCLVYLQTLGFEYTLHSQQQQALLDYQSECQKIMETLV